MTLEELYGKIMADDALKTEVAQAAKDGKLVEWAAAQGVEATEEELSAFMKGTGNEKLSLDDIDSVAGGNYLTKVVESVGGIPIGKGC